MFKSQVYVRKDLLLCSVSGKRLVKDMKSLDDWEAYLLELIAAPVRNEKCKFLLNVILDPKQYLTGKSITHYWFDPETSLNDVYYGEIVSHHINKTDHLEFKIKYTGSDGFTNMQSDELI